ncbi:MAG: hypothetical protein ACE5FL_06705 [Myxococcota bacterium]
MRKLAAAAASLFILTAAPAAFAEDEEEEYVELPTAVNSLLAGLNGIVTAPADPIMAAVQPIEDFEDMWGAPWTSHPIGLLQGTMLMPYRLVMGVLDIAFAPFWVFPTLSPEARYEIIPGYEIEYE